VFEWSTMKETGSQNCFIRYFAEVENGSILSRFTPLSRAHCKFVAFKYSDISIGGRCEVLGQIRIWSALRIQR